MIYAIAAVVVLILDQAVKFWTINHIPLNAIGDQCVTLIPGVIHMTNVQNTGAAFSILSNAKWLLIGVSGVFIVAIIVLINAEIIRTKFGRWTSVLVAAGALGNAIDRLLFGYVVDMFEFEIFSFTVFNVADIFITVCGILFCLHVIIYRDPMELPKEKKQKPARAPRRRRRPVSELDMEDEPYYEDRQPAEEPERPVSRKAARQAARQAKEEMYANIPHRDRGEHRSLADELKLENPDDPFAEWSFDDTPAPARAPETPAPQPEAKPARRRPAPQAEAPAEAEAAAPRKAPEKKAAAPAKPAQPRPAPEKKPETDGGLDSYSLDDILAEFRDS